MASLKKALKERSKLFRQQTNDILASIAHATKAAEVIIDKDTLNVLKWISVDLVDDVVLIVGIAQFPVGHYVTLASGERVIVERDTQDLFTRAVRVGLPYKLVAKGNVDQIKKYLFDGLRETARTGVEPDHTSTIPVDIEEMDPANEFTTDGLTHEQITQVQYHLNARTKGKLN